MEKKFALEQEKTEKLEKEREEIDAKRASDEFEREQERQRQTEEELEAKKGEIEDLKAQNENLAPFVEYAVYIQNDKNPKLPQNVPNHIVRLVVRLVREQIPPEGPITFPEDLESTDDVAQLVARLVNLFVERAMEDCTPKELGPDPIYRTLCPFRKDPPCESPNKKQKIEG